MLFCDFYALDLVTVTFGLAGAEFWVTKKPPAGQSKLIDLSSRINAAK